jgi:hypothetical protein
MDYLDTIAPSVNVDGGWGYLAGRPSRLEPTAWASLALSVGAARAGRGALLARAGARLASWQRPDGLVAEPGLPANLAFNGLVLLAFDAAPPVDRSDALRAAGRRLEAALRQVRGRSTGSHAAVRQDNTLVGWPWNEASFPWVEPTAWCLLALKRRRRGAPTAGDERIEAAEKLLGDRACAGGGWNFGNSNAFGQDLRAYVPTTAVSLLALQDRRGAPEVVAGVKWLATSWPGEQAGHALSLAAIALSVLGVPAGDLLPALDATFGRTAFLGNLATTAMAACAVHSVHGESTPFTV